MQEIERNGLTYIVSDSYASFDKSKLENQRGQTCGLYALQNALRMFGFDNTNATGHKTHSIESLRDIAKKNKFTSIGEILELNIFNELTNLLHLPVTAEILRCEFENFQFNKSDPNLCYLVPFDVSYNEDDKAKPCCVNGANAHWCLIVGIGDPEEESGGQVLAYHWGREYIFDISDLCESNHQLQYMPPSNHIKWKKEALYSLFPNVTNQANIDIILKSVCPTFFNSFDNISYRKITKEQSDLVLKHMGQSIEHDKDPRNKVWYKSPMFELVENIGGPLTGLIGGMIKLTKLPQP